MCGDNLAIPGFAMRRRRIIASHDAIAPGQALSALLLLADSYYIETASLYVKFDVPKIYNIGVDDIVAGACILRRLWLQKTPRNSAKCSEFNTGPTGIVLRVMAP